eukprot:1835346-Pyramimonas_sp.AAC.1
MEADAAPGAQEKTSSSPVPRPPSAAALSLFSTSHVLDESGRRCNCCGGSASRAVATKWRQSECFQPVNYNGSILYKPPLARLHIVGWWVDQSHAMQYHTHLKLW